MAKCPKCGLDFSVALKKCPNCQTMISPKTKEIFELPKLKKEKEEVIPVIVEPKKEVVVKPIPLKVRKVEEHYDGAVEKNEKKVFRNFKLISTIKAAVVLVLLVLNGYLIFRIALQVDSTKPSEVIEIEEPVIEEVVMKLSLNGQWITQNSGSFIFQDNNNFYWYDNYRVKDDNYYGGTYTYKRGLDAIIEMGYTEEEFKKNFEEEIDLDNVYSLNMIPNFAYKDRKDNTVNALNENEAWWYLIIINKDNTAYGYNKTLDLRYNLKKVD